MELRHLRYLVAVAEEQSFTRAAERLHIAQPGVSAQIRQLEHELGQTLFDRASRTVSLTAAGEAFLPYARAALEAASAGAATVDALVGLTRGHLSLGTVGTMNSAALDLPGRLAVFHEAHPGIDITLHEDDTVNLIQALHERRVDAAFLGLGQFRIPAGIRTVELVRDVLVAVLPTETAAGRQRLQLADLARGPLIVPRPGTAIRSLLDTAFAAAGLSPRVAFESGDPSVLVRLAHAGLGTAIAPSSAAERHPHGRFAALPLHPRLEGRIGLAWRDQGPQSPAARAFIRQVRLTTEGMQEPIPDE